MKRTAIAHAIEVIEARGPTPADKAILDVYRAKQARSAERERARQLLILAVRRGDVARWPCQVCGEKAEMHHPTYDQPLNVVWLCHQHHLAAHAATRAVDRSREHERQMTEFQRLMALPELFPMGETRSNAN
jgi:hypothetical protein